jgi:flagellar protein FliO/FliZ
MLDFLFGEGNTAFKVVFALIVVLLLLALAVWLLRRFSGERLSTASARGRQPRLAVIDAASVDGRRRLVLIRRDNVEHLLMIGGPTDVVVELNIVRAAGAAREPAPARPPAATETRPVPFGEGTMWPLQPEPATRLEPVQRAELPPRAEPAPRPQRPPPAVEAPGQWSEPQPSPPQPPARERRPRTADPLAGLAEELTRVPGPPEAAPIEQPLRQPPRREPRAPGPPEAAPVEQPLRQPPRREPRAPRPAPPSPAPQPAAETEFNPSDDQNLAEMAQRLEAALRRPPRNEDARPAQGAPRAAPAPAAADVEESAAPPSPSPAAPPDATRPARGAPTRAGAQPAPQKSLYDSLEQEMASLLGRPNSKP